ncbi:flavodoxin [Lachnospiraceae bacterium 62-35]
MKNIIRILSTICLLAVLFCMTACFSSTARGESIGQTELNATEQMKETEKEYTPQMKATEGEETQEKASSEKMPGERGNILVAYFSATGTTKALAETASDILKADLYEIVPEVPYAKADLNYSDNSSRTSVEMNDSSARPAILGSVENMEQYDIIFLGYPIWWGEAPRIIDTFMESYEFSGKTIVPFCTSGSSEIGSSAESLHGLCAEDVIWLDGTRLSSGISHQDMADWIGSLGLDVEAE